MSFSNIPDVVALSPMVVAAQSMSPKYQPIVGMYNMSPKCVSLAQTSLRNPSPDIICAEQSHENPLQEFMDHGLDSG